MAKSTAGSKAFRVFSGENGSLSLTDWSSKRTTHNHGRPDGLPILHGPCKVPFLHRLPSPFHHCRHIVYHMHLMNRSTFVNLQVEDDHTWRIQIGETWHIGIEQING